jgi:hypothetical protein
MKQPTAHTLLALACLSIAAAWMPAKAQSLQYIGQQIVPSGTQYLGTTVGGLSGLDFVASSGRYVAISDDRSGFNPARFYELTLDLAQFARSANPGQAGVGFQSVTTILDPAGLPFATNTLDPEGIRYNASTSTLVWSNEGQRAAAGLQNPTVREMTLGGSAVRNFAVPATFNPVGSVSGGTAGDSGIRNNLAFESLTYSTDGSTLYTATENALVQDGPAAGVGQGSASRILSFDTATGAAGVQWAYQVDPVALAPNPANGFATNGLVELLAIGDRQFVAVERSFAAGAVTPGVGPNGLPTGNTIRLYYVDARAATDVSGVASLAGAGIVPVSKTLLLDLSTLKHDDGTPLALDNIEGITWGPDYAGKPTLVLVSDNNFSGSQFTQFVALSVIAPIPEPASWALMAAGLGVLLSRRKR